MRTNKYKDWDDIGEGIIKLSFFISFIVGTIQLCVGQFLMLIVTALVCIAGIYVGWRMYSIGLLWDSWYYNTYESDPLLTYDEVEKFMNLGVLYWNVGTTLTDTAAIHYIGIVKDKYLDSKVGYTNYDFKCTRVGVVFEDYKKVHRLLSEHSSCKVSSVVKDKQEEIEKTLDALMEKIKNGNGK